MDDEELYSQVFVLLPACNVAKGTRNKDKSLAVEQPPSVGAGCESPYGARVVCNRTDELVVQQDSIHGDTTSVKMIQHSLTFGGCLSILIGMRRTVETSVQYKPGKGCSHQQSTVESNPVQSQTRQWLAYNGRSGRANIPAESIRVDRVLPSHRSWCRMHYFRQSHSSDRAWRKKCT